MLRWNGTVKELHGGERQTTNNRMELMAAIRALEALNRPSQVLLYTDSKYLLDGITKWIAGWQRNGWRTSARQPVKNEDLWRRLVQAMNGHEVSWLWVKGHAGDEGNERATRWPGSASRRPRPSPSEPRAIRTAGRRRRPGPDPR